MQKLKRIMLIDDNEDDNWYHKRVINKNHADTKVVTVQSGNEALELLKGESTDHLPHPDLIFLDINMPGMNGWQFLEEYKQMNFNGIRSVVVIMLTTSDSLEDLEKAQKIDILSDFKTKPLTNAMIDDIIAKHFS
ncbi:MAG: response regulator [Ferruginibacter sp.]